MTNAVLGLAAEVPEVLEVPEAPGFLHAAIKTKV